MTSMTDRSGVRQVLCCECGNLRTVKAGAGRRNHVSAGESPERIAELMAFAPDYWSHIKPYHRFLRDLKCTPCGKVTQHATVVPASSRDWAEEENLGAAARAASPGPVAADPFAVVESLGIQLIDVDGLARSVIYVNAHEIALVRAGMDAKARQEAGEWLLREVVEGGAR